MNVSTINAVIPNALNSVPGLQADNVNNSEFMQMLSGLITKNENNVLTENSFNLYKAQENNEALEIQNMNFQIPLDNSLVSKLKQMGVEIDTNAYDSLSDNDKDITINTESENEDYKKLLENYKIISQLNYINPQPVSNDSLSQDNVIDYGKSVYEYMGPLQKQFSVYKNSDMISLNNNNNLSEIQNNIKPLVKETYSSIQAEKLMSLINSHKNDLKNEIDFNKAALVTNKVPISDNKIITIVDESQELKPQVLNQVSDKIELMIDDVQDGETKQVTMELHPVKLGKVEIKMTYEDKKLSVEIISENEETQKILSSNKNELTKILSKSIEGEVNVIVKENVAQYEFKAPLADSHNEGQGRQKNHYYQQENDNKSEDNEEIDFSELINLRNLKFSKV